MKDFPAGVVYGRDHIQLQQTLIREKSYISQALVINSRILLLCHCMTEEKNAEITIHPIKEIHAELQFIY